MGKSHIIINAFGLNPVSRIEHFVMQNTDVPKQEKSKFNIPAVPTPDAPLRQSMLGTPVFSDLSFSQVTDNGVLLPVFKPIDLALFTVVQSKNIVTTAIQGRKGTVKEYISAGDDQINIKGAIVGDPGVYPEAAVQNLLAYLNAAVSLPINSAYLQRIGIYEIVINDYNISQRAGYYDIQFFEINAISDTPVILKIPK